MGFSQRVPVFAYKQNKRGRKPLWSQYEEFIKMVMNDLGLSELHIAYSDSTYCEGTAFTERNTIVVDRGLFSRAVKEVNEAKFAADNMLKIDTFLFVAEVIAHELRHLWQKKNTRLLDTHKDWKSFQTVEAYNLQPPEIDANGYGYEAVQKFYGQLFPEEVKKFHFGKNFIKEGVIWKLKYQI